MSDKYQTVMLVLTDGRRLTYTGKEQIEDVDNMLRIATVLFTRGKPMPAGCYFSEIETKP